MAAVGFCGPETLCDRMGSHFSKYLLVVVMTVVGCGPTLEQQFQQAQNNAIQICRVQVEDNPELSSLKNIGLFDNYGANMKIMTNYRIPTGDEMIAFRYYTMIRQNCRDAWLSVVAMRGPQFAANGNSLRSAADRVDAEFLTGKYTWADYGKVISMLLDQYQTIDAQLIEQAQQNAYAQQQAQAANTAAWAASMQAIGQAMQAQQAQRPQQTNCQMFGNQMSCTQW